MFIDMAPGAHRGNLLNQLRQILSSTQNLSSSGAHTRDLISAYSQWATDTASVLSGQLTSREIERLVFTRRYELILTMTSLSSGTIRSMLRLEINERIRDFESIVSALQNQMLLWPHDSTKFVSLDTGVYIHGDKIEELDLQRILGGTLDPIRLLIPMVVIDELDRLKEKGEAHVRWRAGYTLAFLDKTIKDPRTPAQLFSAGFTGEGEAQIPRNKVTVEIILDRPGHVRLPSDDDELIDRLMAVQPLAERPITLLTYDSGMRHRATARDLLVKKLEWDLGPEPNPPGKSTRAMRKERQAAQERERQQPSVGHEDASAGHADDGAPVL